MGVLQKIGRLFGQRVQTRGYDAGKKDRLTKDWKADGRGEDADTLLSISELRNRARTLQQNNPWAKRYLRLARINIPGPKGFTLQMDVEEQTVVDGKFTTVSDEVANIKIEEAFALWSKPEHCTVTGQMSFRQVQHLLVTHAKRDGEYLVRKVYDAEALFGFRLQVLEPYLLDETYNAKLPNGNVVRMGIEMDQWRKPLAYHIRKIEPSLSLFGFERWSRDRERVSASDIYHGFDFNTAFQARGVSEMSPAMLRLRHLGEAETASVVRFRVGAMTAGLLSNKQGADQTPTEDIGQGPNEDGDVVVKLQSGQMLDVGNKELQKFDPEFPSEQYAPFVKSQLRGIASGVGVSYNLLANDLEGVNYSSLRAGVLDERESWIDGQEWFIESFLNPLFSDWLKMALLTQVLKLPSAKFDKFNRPRWIGRRWDWVDPYKDAQADNTTLGSGLDSEIRITATRGLDYEDVCRLRAKAAAIRKKYGLPDPQYEAAPKAKKVEEKDDEDDEKEEKDERAIAPGLLAPRPTNGHTH